MTLQSELDSFKASWLERVGSAAATLVADDIEALLVIAAQAAKARSGAAVGDFADAACCRNRPKRGL